MLVDEDQIKLPHNFYTPRATADADLIIIERREETITKL